MNHSASRQRLAGRGRACRRHRRAVAAVEFALCLPVMVLLVLASIEACTMIFVQQSLETAAYETARFAASPGDTRSLALQRGNQVLADRAVNRAQVAINPSSPQRQDQVDVTVTAPFDQNRLFPQFFFGGQILTADVSMQKE